MTITSLWKISIKFSSTFNLNFAKKDEKKKNLNDEEKIVNKFTQLWLVFFLKILERNSLNLEVRNKRVWYFSGNYGEAKHNGPKVKARSEKNYWCRERDRIL